MHRSSALWIVGGSDFSMPCIQACHDLGFKAIVSDKNPDVIGMQEADFPIIASTYDVDKTIDEADKISEKVDICGVFTAGADVEVTVSSLANYLGLLGIDFDSAKNCKDKIRMRRCLADKGLNKFRWAEISIDIKTDWGNIIGYPLVVKPSDSCASRGVSIVTSHDLLDSAIEKAAKVSTTGEVLLEERLIGTEHSVEILWLARNNYIPLNITDRLFQDVNSIPIEVGHVNPSKLAWPVQLELYKLAKQASEAVGICWGPFKCDVIITKDGPRILEVTARLSGGYDSTHTTPMSSGRNFVKTVARQASGLPFDSTDLMATKNKYAAAYWLLHGDEDNCAERKSVRFAVDATYEGAWQKAKYNKGAEVVERCH